MEKINKELFNKVNEMMNPFLYYLQIILKKEFKRERIMDIKKFKPVKYGKYIKMLIEGKKCKICGKIMIEKSDSLFPKYNKINQEAQMKKVDLAFFSKTKVDDAYICCECEKSGKADFLCQLCNKRKPTSKIKESFGIYDTDFLCTECFETKTAKDWEEKCDKLYKEHKYDGQ